MAYDRRSARMGLCPLLAAVVVGLPAVGCGEHYRTTMTYELPSAVTVPREVRTYAVVYDDSTSPPPDFTWIDRAQAQREYVENHSPRVAKLIASRLSNGIREAGMELTQVLRKTADLERILREKKLQRSDLVQPGAASQYAGLLGADAFVVVSCPANVVENEWGVERQINENQRRVYRAVAREVTIDGSLRFDCTNAGILLSETIKGGPERHEEKPKGWPLASFARDRSFSELPAVDGIVDRWANAAVERFVGQLLGEKRDYDVEIESSSNEHCKRGVIALRAGDLDGAQRAFRTATEEDSNHRDHAARFGLGLVAELQGDLDEALRYYEQARSCTNSSTRAQRYGESVERVRKAITDEWLPVLRYGHSTAHRE